jgi:hypothetical protein
MTLHCWIVVACLCIPNVAGSAPQKVFIASSMPPQQDVRTTPNGAVLSETLIDVRALLGPDSERFIFKEGTRYNVMNVGEACEGCLVLVVEFDDQLPYLTRYIETGREHNILRSNSDGIVRQSAALLGAIARISPTVGGIGPCALLKDPNVDVGYPICAGVIGDRTFSFEFISAHTACFRTLQDWFSAETISIYDEHFSERIDSLKDIHDIRPILMSMPNINEFSVGLETDSRVARSTVKVELAGIKCNYTFVAHNGETLVKTLSQTTLGRFVSTPSLCAMPNALMNFAMAVPNPADATVFEFKCGNGRLNVYQDGRTVFDNFYAVNYVRGPKKNGCLILGDDASNVAGLGTYKKIRSEYKLASVSVQLPHSVVGLARSVSVTIDGRACPANKTQVERWECLAQGAGSETVQVDLGVPVCDQ